ncbi:short-chain fatty acid transporter [Halomonas halocynthiae]|uniref:short-chain fatty acid transporter n=1 Tax=Halomonas halocynthiae TaxID=176290 RepID=UPI0003FE3906|nr:TIGR00366 family protein [Halomonas halocynthiae]
MLASIANKFSSFINRFLPDAFIIAVLMTLLVIALAWGLDPQNGVQVISSWGDGFWVYIGFTMQMVLLLMTGMTLASAPSVSALLTRLAGQASGKLKPYALVFIACAIAYYINWGLAVIVGAILAREVGRQNDQVHFPLLVAAAYAPTALYTAGLSSSIGLTVATEGHFMAEVMGVIPTTETMFSPATITIFLALAITMPIIIILMAPKNASKIIPWSGNKEENHHSDNQNDGSDTEKTPASVLENSGFLGRVMGIIGLAYTVYHFATGADLNLNIINLLFLSLGLVLHPSLKAFSNAFSSSANAISPIILQFPFYAGIIAVLSSSTLGDMIVTGLTGVATSETFNVFTYLSAGLVNILAPSGGGQWALQGPLQIPAAISLGVDPATTAMAVGWGDAWTNLIQPFWALPILSVVGLHIRHIMGYCILLSVWVGIVTSILIYLLY